jgi:hypothetical protein
VISSWLVPLLYSRYTLGCCAETRHRSRAAAACERCFGSFFCLPNHGFAWCQQDPWPAGTGDDNGGQVGRESSVSRFWLAPFSSLSELLSPGDRES